MSNPFRNEQGEISGTKLILVLAAALAGAWAVRDLVAGLPLTESHVALLGFLLVVGLLNRISARGSFRLRVGGNEIEVKDSNHDR